MDRQTGSRTKRTILKNLKEIKSRDSRVSFAISILFVFLVLALIVQLAMGTYLGRFQPHSFLLYVPTDMPGDIIGLCRDHHWGNHFFGDFQSVYCKSLSRAPYEGASPGSYFPAAYLLMRPLEVFGDHYWLRFVSWTAFGVVLLVVATHRLLKFPKGTGWFTCVALCLACWPLVAALDRGNIQVHVVALIIIGVGGIDNRRNFLSPVAVGVAAGFKGYPLIFSVVFIRRREWSKLVTCWGVFFVLNLGSLFLMRGGIYYNIKTFLRQVASFSGAGSGGFEQYGQWFLSTNSSLQGLFASFEKLDILRLNELGKYGIANHRVIEILLILIVALAVILLKLPLSRLIFILTATPLLVIGLTAQYSLLILLVPICVWCAESNNNAYDKIGVSLLVVTAVIMAPITIPFNRVNVDQRGVATFSSVSVGSLGRPLLLCIVIGLVIVEGIVGSKYHCDSPPPQNEKF